MVFLLTLFIPHLSFFDTSGKLCFVIVSFPKYIYLYFVTMHKRPQSYCLMSDVASGDQCAVSREYNINKVIQVRPRS